MKVGCRTGNEQIMPMGIRVLRSKLVYSESIEGGRGISRERLQFSLSMSSRAVLMLRKKLTLILL